MSETSDKSHKHGLTLVNIRKATNCEDDLSRESSPRPTEVRIRSNIAKSYQCVSVFPLILARVVCSDAVCLLRVSRLPRCF